TESGSAPGYPNTDRWRIEIRADDGGKPGQVVLYTESVSGAAVPSTVVGGVDGVGEPRTINPRYEFSHVLDHPFAAQRDTVYWVSALSETTNFYPFFSWAAGYPADDPGPLDRLPHALEAGYMEAGCHQFRLGTDDYPSPQVGNRAFTILTLPSNDSDQDGMDDQWETVHGLDTSLDDSSFDPDQDGLANLGEFARRTDPENPDTDADGLDDGFETNTGTYHSPEDRGTNPLVADSDGDGLLDGLEAPDAAYPGTHSKSDPNRTDTDSDGLDDKAERVAGTDPSTIDSDADGVSDRWEVEQGTDPRNSADPLQLSVSKPSTIDTRLTAARHDNTPNEFHVRNDHTVDATFRLLVDFEPKQGDDREVLFEVGGRPAGCALTYEPGNLIVLRWQGVSAPDAQEHELPIASISWKLTERQLARGDLEILWGYDTLNASGTQSVGLWIDGVLCDEQSMQLGSEWSMRGDSAFAHQSVKGCFFDGWVSASASAFKSGSINFSVGLEHSRDAYPVTSYARPPVMREISFDPTRDEVTLIWSSEATEGFDSPYVLETSRDLRSWVYSSGWLYRRGPTMSITLRRQTGHQFYRVRLLPPWGPGGEE
ncbi:MAG: hypothetical protein ACR2RV_13375, partial [Verrucomicrobiales bacterium]